MASDLPTVIGLDLARATGYVVRSPCGVIREAGEINITQTPFVSPTSNGFHGFTEHYSRLLHRVLQDTNVSNVIVVYENVQFSTSRAQANIWCGLRALIYALSLWPVYGIPVGTIKKFATDKGNASKEMMFDHLPTKQLKKKLTTDNMVDAWWVSELARDLYVKGTLHDNT